MRTHGESTGWYGRNGTAAHSPTRTTHHTDSAPSSGWLGRVAIEAIILALLLTVVIRLESLTSETRRQSGEILREFRQERDREIERGKRLMRLSDAVLVDMSRIRTLQGEILNGGEKR